MRVEQEKDRKIKGFSSAKRLQLAHRSLTGRRAKNAKLAIFCTGALRKGSTTNYAAFKGGAHPHTLITPQEKLLGEGNYNLAQSFFN